MRRIYEFKKILYAVICICILGVSFFACDTAEASTGRSTGKKIVRVGWFESPFNFKDRYGRRTGYAYDYQKKIAAYTGWTYEYVNGSWVELMDMLRKGEIDMMSDVSFTDERAEEMLFSTQPMGAEEYFLFVKDNQAESNSDDFTYLNGARVGVNRGSIQEKLFINWAEAHKVDVQLVHLDGNERKSAAALKNGEIDAIVSVSIFAPYYENAYPIAAIGASSFYFAVNKNRSDLWQELDAAMSQIQNLNRYYNKKLNEKYLSSEESFRFLPGKEVTWLKMHGPIRVGYWDNYMPFCAKDEETGELKGFLADCLTRFSTSMKNVKVEFKPVAYANLKDAVDALQTGEIDCLFPMTLDTYEAEQNNVLVTEGFGTSGLLALVRSKDHARFNPMDDIIVAVDKGNIRMEAVIREAFPNWQILYCNSVDECLKRVVANEADCFLLSNYRLNRFMPFVGRYGLIPVSTGKTMHLAFAVQKDHVLLYSILGRMTNSITDAETYALLGRSAYSGQKASFWEYVREHFVLTLVIMFFIIAVISIMFVRSVRATRKAQTLNVELEKAREAAEAANSAKTSFLFNMSHDIRTPMNAIMGLRDLLEKHQEEPEKRAQYLVKIKDASRVLLSILNNVLEMARIEKGTLILDESECDVGQFAESMYTVFHEMMEQKNIKYTMQLDVKHQYVYCDATKTNEVFMNILSNAYKYTNAGGSVHIHLEELPGDRAGWTVFRTTISDTGIGMSEEFLPHLFEEFSREHNTTSTKIEGTGLGMPIVKRLVEFMNGTVEVKSKLGEGTTFIVTIPLRIAEKAGANQPSVVAIDPEQFKGKSILMAEDNEINAEIAKAILGDAGFIVEHVSDGNICVEAIENSEPHKYDVILMDIQMPNMNGYEAARIIRNMKDKEKADIPIIAMTANAFEEDKREAFKAGMNGHIAKPIDVRLLMNEIARVLKNSE
ncbi:transporter substrate-binding domain-containing protein [Schwartzia sp. (in: firmicutes)]